MRTATFLVTALLVGSLASPVHATARESTAMNRLEAARSLEHADPAAWDVSWDERTGAPEIVSGSRTSPLAGARTDAPKAARDFLLGHAALFRLRPGIDDLAHDRTVEMSGIRHIHLEQTYRGLPVLEAGYNVALDAEGRVVMVTGSLQPDLTGEVGALISQPGSQLKLLDLATSLQVAHDVYDINELDRTGLRGNGDQ